MAGEGVSTKPILLISGNSPFCETFFDNVKVPKSQRVHDENKGWDVAKYLLGHEREMISGMGLGGAAGNPLLDGAIATVGLVDNGQLGRASCRERVCQYV